MFLQQLRERISPFRAGRKPQRWALVVATGLSLTGSLQAEPSKELSRAVRDLDARTFTARRQASDRLLQAGAEAVPLLRKAVESSDSLEVRYRATDLLMHIERRLLELRAEAIRSGQDVSDVLPAWGRFAEQVGSNAKAREWFIRLLRTAPELMLSIGTDDLQEEFERCVGEWTTSALRRSGAALPAEEVAVLIFAMSQPECRPSPMDASAVALQALSDRLQGERADDAGAPLVNALLSNWVARREGGPASFRLQVAKKYDLADGLIPAREIIEGVQQGGDPQDALIFIARKGGLAELHEVEALLTNPQELYSSSQRESGKFTTEIRDVALIACWKIAREDPKAHGITSYREDGGRPRANTTGFAKDEDRVKAIGEWRQWRKAHVKEWLPGTGQAVEGRST